MSKLKVGDRVKVINNAMFNRDRLGKEGVVIQIRQTGNPVVRFDDGQEDYGYTRDLELISAAPDPIPAPTIPDEIEINGETYRRVAKEAEPKTPPAPACGQIWRDAAGDVVCVAQVGRRKYQAVSLNRPHTFWGEPKDAPDCVRDGARSESWQYLAPSLADALERGLITAVDLR